MKATKDHLLKGARARTTDTVELADGSEVTVRPLTRNEGIQVSEAATTEAKDNLIISLGMVDPKMTPDEVAEWGKVGVAGDLQAVSHRIAQLSGMLPDAGKEAYKSPRG